MKLTDLTLEQLESIIKWNENGNDCLSDYEYDKADLIETVKTYLEDMTLDELLEEAKIQCDSYDDIIRMNCRGINNETIKSINNI